MITSKRRNRKFDRASREQDIAPVPVRMSALVKHHLPPQPCLPCHAPRITIFSASSGNGCCRAFASSHGARIHTSHSSSVVRITGMALGWIRLDDGIRRSRQETVDKANSGRSSSSANQMIPRGDLRKCGRLTLPACQMIFDVTGDILADGSQLKHLVFDGRIVCLLGELPIHVGLIPEIIRSIHGRARAADL